MQNKLFFALKLHFFFFLMQYFSIFNSFRWKYDIIYRSKIKHYFQMSQYCTLVKHLRLVNHTWMIVDKSTNNKFLAIYYPKCSTLRFFGWWLNWLSVNISKKTVSIAVEVHVWLYYHLATCELCCGRCPRTNSFPVSTLIYAFLYFSTFMLSNPFAIKFNFV